MNKIDLLVAEIGSTTTVVNAFNNLENNPEFIGQGQAATTVLEGNVNIGLQDAIDDLEDNLNKKIRYKTLLATSSAAGGLKMTVHGLVYDMTVKAAKEAALGAGANIKSITAGKLRQSDLNKIKEINPNIILIAGGVDYGERDTALYNSQLIADLNLNIPIIYAGNIENQEEVKEIFKYRDSEIFIVENVYPKIDELNIEPTRKVIQNVFEKHITKAPGMENIREIVTGQIMPTPGAVMQASKLLYEEIGDLITIDVGGATTDIHSVTQESEEISRILLNPEPLAKRTVEGDLGVYINMKNIIDMIGIDTLLKELGIEQDNLNRLIENHKPIPETKLEKEFVGILTKHASLIALTRHAGNIKHLYGPGGKNTVAMGKDLTQVKYIIGTGGALTRLPNRIDILKELPSLNKGNQLFPNLDSEILIDSDYIMASLGVMSLKYFGPSLRILKSNLNIES